MALSDIFNVIEIDATTTLAGMPTREQCQDVHDAGHRLVINLAPHDGDGALAEEATIWAEMGIAYRYIPVAWDKPEPEQLDRFIAELDKSEGQKVFIHCQANFRVTAFYALYAMHKLGWSREQAQSLIDSIWKSRSDYRMDPTWKAFVEDGMARLS